MKRREPGRPQRASLGRARTRTSYPRSSQRPPQPSWHVPRPSRGAAAGASWRTFRGRIAAPIPRPSRGRGGAGVERHRPHLRRGARVLRRRALARVRVRRTRRVPRFQRRERVLAQRRSKHAVVRRLIGGAQQIARRDGPEEAPAAVVEEVRAPHLRKVVACAVVAEARYASTRSFSAKFRRSPDRAVPRGSSAVRAFDSLVALGGVLALHQQVSRRQDLHVARPEKREARRPPARDTPKRRVEGAPLEKVLFAETSGSGATKSSRRGFSKIFAAEAA